MSKNVAVFVDVANIFYAAKAAGVDIDYVTLLKSATAGRDFVRAYAYTGLDPENENQRQFHGFLARSGYKVVSKDIRKYGDGRIKANLDIELVVDLMRTARNLDIAVVVSGDGDFAPAIRAVQQMGVRVEVISFRGNTSSDLIEVADVFTDIIQLARVDKATGRSGRRVAAEGDLSMTEVPDKETEGAIRRRRGRGRGGDRDETAAGVVAAESATSTMPGNLIVLPGEKLSRVAGAADDPAELETLEPAESDVPGERDDVIGEEQSGDGRRRRRRRGGRGRGRGRVEGEAPAIGEAAVDTEDEEPEELEPVRLPQHSTFGSVWDSQLGVPTAPLVTTGQVTDEEDLEDEPEIPEYLLAERRQRSQGHRGRPGGQRMGGGRDRGRAGGYQAAIERERYGRGGPPAAASPFGGPRREERARPDQGRGGRRPARPGGRPERPPREERAPTRPSSGDPWSEVPPELEEMLRAELARKTGITGAASGDGGASDRSLTATAPTLPEGIEPDPGVAPSLALPSETEIRGTLDPSDAVAAGAANVERPVTVDAAPKPRSTRRRGRGDAAPTDPIPDATRVVAAGDVTPEAGSEVAAGPAAAEAATPRRGTRRRTSAAATSPDEAAPVGSETAAKSEATPPRRTGRRRSSSAETAADGAAAGGVSSAGDAATGGAGTGGAAETGTAETTGEAEPKPRRRTTRRTKAAESEG